MSKPQGQIRVLVGVGYYLPGYRGGGPIRSISNLVQGLGAEIRFSIVTRDRDLGQRRTYPGVRVGEWRALGAADVCYLSPQRLAWRLGRLARETPHDVLYLNSAFSPYFTLLPLLLRLLRLLDRRPALIVAPRGEFSPGALAIRASKKRAFLRLAKLTELYRDVLWQASSLKEAADIERVIGPRAAVYRGNTVVAPDLAGGYTGTSPPPRAKTSGAARIVFLSRISPMKNLLGAIELLRGVDGEIVFDIYGPLEDSIYWGKCRQQMESLPGNIRVSYRGEASHDQVDGLLRGYHLLLLPTKGENFGHVIQEALAAGCSVAVSDRTPWHGLEEAGAGWDLPLEADDRWTRALREIVDADQNAFDHMSESAVRLASELFAAPQALAENRLMFELALRRRSPRLDRIPGRRGEVRRLRR